MTELIDKAKAIEIASGICHWTNIPKELDKLPTTEIVRCKDCRFWDRTYIAEIEAHACYFMRVKTYKHDFCSMGKMIEVME